MPWRVATRASAFSYNRAACMMRPQTGYSPTGVPGTAASHSRTVRSIESPGSARGRELTIGLGCDPRALDEVDELFDVRVVTGLRARESARDAVAVHALVVFDVQVDDGVPGGLADHAHRILPGRDAVDLALEHLSEQDHTAIGRAEFLQFAFGDRALRNPGHHVLRVEEFEQEFAVGFAERHLVLRDAVEHVRGNLDAGMHRVGVVPVVHRRRIVDRYANLERVRARAVALRTDGERVGEEDRMPDLPVVGIFGLSLVEPPLVEAVLELVERDRDVVTRDRKGRLDPVALLLDELLQMTVQPLRVHGIARVLHD